MREARTKQLQSSPETIDLKVQQLPAMRAMKLLHRLARAAAPALAAAGKGTTGRGLLDLDLGNLSEAAMLLFDRFSETDLQEVTNTLLEEALITINGKTQPVMPVFDLVLAGKLELVFKALAFALEVNYASFMPAARAMLASRAAEVSAPVSSSPTT